MKQVDFLWVESWVEVVEYDEIGDDCTVYIGEKQSNVHNEESPFGYADYNCPPCLNWVCRKTKG